MSPPFNMTSDAAARVLQDVAFIFAHSEAQQLSDMSGLSVERCTEVISLFRQMEDSLHTALHYQMSMGEEGQAPPEGEK